MNNHKLEHERNLNAILDRLKRGGYTTHNNPRDIYEPHRVERQTLKFLIIEAIHEANRGTLSKWINELIALKVISPNPTSQEWNHNGIIMPHDSTLYFLHFDNPLFDRHTLTPQSKPSVQPTLDPDTSSISF